MDDTYPINQPIIQSSNQLIISIAPIVTRVSIIHSERIGKVMVKNNGLHILAVYEHLDNLIEGIKYIKSMGYRDFIVYSPVPHHSIDEQLYDKPSPVRYFTLAGGLIGLSAGWLLTIHGALSYSLVVGGKPVISIPAFSIIAYVMTILIAAIATISAFSFYAKIPKRKIPQLYDERFSCDHFGLHVYSTIKNEKEIVEELRNIHSKEMICYYEQNGKFKEVKRYR